MKLCFDTGHLLFGGGDVMATLNRWGDRVHHVHFKDIRPPVVQDTRENNRSFLDAVIAGAFTVPSDGCIDFQAVATALKAMDYEGWIVVEAEQDPAKAPPYEYSKMGYDHIVHVCGQAGLEITKRNKPPDWGNTEAMRKEIAMVNQDLGYVGYFDRESCDLDEFKVLTSQNLLTDAVPHAASVNKNVPIYDMNALRPALEKADKRRAVLAEWGHVLDKSAGVIVLKGAFADTSVIDRATEVFLQIIDEERQSGSGEGDHFAASGANDRIWNALQKQCLRDPEGFALYFGNTAIAAACEAWLGPNYQVTAQINQVRPGGKAQQAHRDYHLGFQSADSAARYPAHAHLVTASLTLQGAVAHCDMPVESGPTKLLPFSQLYPSGYLAFHDPAHRGYFDGACIQLPFSKRRCCLFQSGAVSRGG